MKVISFDQSTTKSGYCIFIDGKYERSGLIDKSKDKNLDSRFHKMYEGIYEIIKDEFPDIVVIEGTQMQGGNASTYKVLCQLQGAIIGMCYAMGISFDVMMPVEWRKILGYHQGPKVKREELKQQSMDFVKKEFGINKSIDEVEAIAIGVAFHRMSYKNI